MPRARPRGRNTPRLEGEAGKPGGVARGICISLDRVCVPTRCAGLESICVQLYLDDTSNGDDGAGNTLFLHMPVGEDGTFGSSNVEWNMVGSNHNVPPGSMNHAMPDVAKVVVTANAVGPTGAIRHGVVGGSTIGLKDMLESLRCEGEVHIPIVNSFFPEMEVGSLPVCATHRPPVH